MIKNWEKFNEDVYWGSKDIMESDKERNERILKWVENYVDEQVGLDIMNVSVGERWISVHYKRGHRYEDRKGGSRSGMPPEEAKKRMTDDWHEMAMEMIEEMRYDHNHGYENGLGLDLRDDYSLRANENGYFIETNDEFPKIKTGEHSPGFGG